MVGWNLQGYRLGFGGGYYDRFLYKFQGLKIGIGWECGKLSENDLKFDPWDKKMDMIVTEENSYII